jgi:GR25 family glycosyltransferase involved in LPS biosynthesis
MKFKKNYFPYIIICLFIILVLFNYQKTIIYFEVDKNELGDFRNSNSNKLTNIYYINVDKSIDRNNRFLSRLYPTINPIRISAITPNTLPIILKPKLCDGCTDTEFACTLSHLKAIYTAYINNEKYAIIMEDDAIILRNFNWDKLINLAPDNWEILQIHTTCVPFTTSFYHPIFKYRHTNKLWIKSSNFMASCACYIVSKKGMEKMISLYLKNIDNYSIDDYFNKNNTLDWKDIKTTCQADGLIYNHFNKFVCTQMLIDVENFDSDIRDMNHPWSTCHKHSKDFIKNNLHNQ